MAGPNCFLLLPEKLTETQVARISKDALAISDRDSKSQYSDWDLYVVDTRPIGGSYVGGGYPFGIDKEAMTFEDEDAVQEKRILQSHFGFAPVQTMDFNAFVNGRESHRILGELVLHFATLFDGIVDFDGPLLPYNMRENGLREDWSLMNRDWSEVKTFSDEMVASLPGKAVAIEYKTGDGRTWACHYGDSTFLRAWLEHPYFHMTK